MTPKRRLSATVDADLFDLVQRGVAAGTAPSTSAWVNDALRLKAEQDRRLAAIDAFLAEYESAHGGISDEEIDEALHRIRGRAVVVRGRAGARARRGGAG